MYWSAPASAMSSTHCNKHKIYTTTIEITCNKLYLFWLCDHHMDVYRITKKNFSSTDMKIIIIIGRYQKVSHTILLWLLLTIKFQWSANSTVCQCATLKSCVALIVARAMNVLTKEGFGDFLSQTFDHWSTECDVGDKMPGQVKKGVSSEY